MAQCVYCTADTNLYHGSVPICVRCANEREAQPPATTQQIRNALLQDVLKATAQNNEATTQFDSVMGQYPSGLPHPDGAQRIKNASTNLILARREMMRAHTRLNDFIERGVVPDDLKKSG